MLYIDSVSFMASTSTDYFMFELNFIGKHNIETFHFTLGSYLHIIATFVTLFELVRYIQHIRTMNVRTYTQYTQQIPRYSF